MPFHCSHDALPAPPGDGIAITHSDDGISVSITARLSGKGLGCGVPVLVFFGPLACIAMSFSLMLLLEFDQPDLKIVTILAAIGLVSFYPVCNILMTVVLPIFIRSTVEIGHDLLRISDRNRVVEIPREDIKSVAVVYLKRPQYQCHVGKDSPTLRSRGAGIAIETTHGTVKTLDCWDHEVSRWLSELLGKCYGIPAVDDEHANSLNSAAPVSSGTPSRIARKDLRILGPLLLLVGGVFVCLFGSVLQRYFDARQWQQVTAIVSAIEKVESEGGSHLDVTYRYDVRGNTYENSRFEIDDGYSSRVERRKEGLKVSDRIEIWYDPADPERSTVERDFPWAAFSVSVVSAIVGLTGVVVLVYSFLGKDSALALRYAVPSDSEDQ